MTVEAGTFIVMTFTLLVLGWHLIVFKSQLREMANSSRSQSIISVINFLQDERVRLARTKVIKELGEKKKWTDEDEFDASLVCSTYDVLAVLIRDGIVSRRPFIEDWGPSICKCYEILGDFIKEKQKPENAGPDYWNDFKWLYHEVSSERTSGK